AGLFQEVLDETFDEADLPFDDLHAGCNLRLVGRGAAYDLHRVRERAERIAQLVRERAEHHAFVVLHGNRPVDPALHRLQAARRLPVRSSPCAGACPSRVGAVPTGISTRALVRARPTSSRGFAAALGARLSMPFEKLTCNKTGFVLFGAGAGRAERSAVCVA